MSTELESRLDARLAEQEKVLREQEAAKAKALQLEESLARGFRPSRDRMVVRKSTRATTEGGILLPDKQKQRPVTGTVIAVGPEVKDFKPGDIVLFMEYAGVDIETTSGNTLSAFFVCTEDEIFGCWNAAG